MALIRRAGFTMIELLVVLAVAGVLLALAVPAIRGIRDRALAGKCMSNLRQIGIALNGYLQDHDQQMPDLEAGRRNESDEGDTIDTVLAEYAGDRSVFACPADQRFARETGTSYYWNVTLNGQRTTSLNFLGLVDEHTRIPVLSDKEGWHPGENTKVNILYADGHAGRGLNLTTGN